MSIELKQAAQQALDAFDAFGEDDNFASLFALDQKMEALRTALQQAESEPVAGPTTYQQRFTEVVSLLCRASPPADMVEGWLTPEADDHRLQEWAIEHAPNWSQGIGVLDAAHVMADQPAEGDEHEMRNTRSAPGVPMTREQVFASDELMALNGSVLGLNMRDLMQVIRIVESHHGISAQAKKETP